MHTPSAQDVKCVQSQEICTWSWGHLQSAVAVMSLCKNSLKTPPQRPCRHLTLHACRVSLGAST